MVNGHVLEQGTEREFDLPVIINYLGKMVRVEADAENIRYDSLATPTIAPGEMLGRNSGISRLRVTELTSEDSRLEWFRTVTAILQTEPASEEFFERTAKALVDLVGLTSGQVLLKEGGRWRTMASALDGQRLSSA